MKAFHIQSFSITLFYLQRYLICLWKQLIHFNKISTKNTQKNKRRMKTMKILGNSYMCMLFTNFR